MTDSAERHLLIAKAIGYAMHDSEIRGQWITQPHDRLIVGNIGIDQVQY
jgi:hypothetical protein